MLVKVQTYKSMLSTGKFFNVGQRIELLRGALRSYVDTSPQNRILFTHGAHGVRHSTCGTSQLVPAALAIIL